MYHGEITSVSSRHEGKRGWEPRVTFNPNGIRFALNSLLVYKILGTSARRQHSQEAWPGIWAHCVLMENTVSPSLVCICVMSETDKTLEFYQKNAIGGDYEIVSQHGDRPRIPDSHWP